jgi:hypothetical protein
MDTSDFREINSIINISEVDAIGMAHAINIKAEAGYSVCLPTTAIVNTFGSGTRRWIKVTMLQLIDEAFQGNLMANFKSTDLPASLSSLGRNIVCN